MRRSSTQAIAGLPLDPYFSAAKLRWFIDHVPEAKELLREKRLRLGTSEAFFLARLTGNSPPMSPMPRAPA